MKYINILLLVSTFFLSASSFAPERQTILDINIGNKSKNSCSTHPYKWTCPKELYVLSEAIYFEARSEHYHGQEAVAFVIMNRVTDEDFPSSIKDVVYQNSGKLHRCQFSYYCDGKSEHVKDIDAWNESVISAIRVYYGMTSDHTLGATFYINPTVSRNKKFFETLVKTKKIGSHVFYKSA